MNIITITGPTFTMYYVGESRKCFSESLSESQRLELENVFCTVYMYNLA